MAWFAANWFWVLIFIAFIAMHVFGHGGHGGGHRHHGSDTARSGDDEPQARDVDTGSSRHQH